ncbi:MAG: FIST signal transduction protein [Acidimicrobiales bacterium]
MGRSEHPTTQVACAQALESLAWGPDRPPDLALVFATAAHAKLLDEVAETIVGALEPGALMGGVAACVVAGDREIEGGPGLAIWAANTGPVTPMHLETVATPDGPAVAGWPVGGNGPHLEEATALLVLADPFSFGTEALLARMATDRPGLAVLGGLASGAREPGGNRLVIGDRVVRTGAVAAILGPGVEVATVVSQGCRPVGNPMVVTRAEGNIIYELAGRPALSRLQELADRLTGPDRDLLARHVHLGRVIDEGRTSFGRGDFLIRSVLGADPGAGALAVGEIVEIGSTVQFQVRDAQSASEDLEQMMTGRQADAGLLFTCNGRGNHLFPTADHDARAVSAALRGAPLAGMSCAGELGPVGGRNFLHGFTASVVLIRNR